MGGFAGASALARCSRPPSSTDSGLSSASGRPWGEVPAGAAGALLPDARRPSALVEVFLFGGLSPWETFYVVPEFGKPQGDGPWAGRQWWTYQDDLALGVPAVAGACGLGDRPMLQPYGVDTAGVTVNLGPFVYPLRDRPDLLARMRVWVMRHDISEHTGGVPLAMTGHRRGSPRMAGFGTHFERYYRDRAPEARSAPHAYCIFHRWPSLLPNSEVATATGLHRASVRPMAVRLGPQADVFDQRIRREAVAGYATDHDALVRHYAQQFRAQVGPAKRVPAIEDFSFARTGIENYEALASILTRDVLTSEKVDACDQLLGVQPDDTGTSLRLATHLVTMEREAARYVQIVEGGLYPDVTGSGYDTHFDHVRKTGANTIHCLRHLVSLINEPGERDPRKLDLDKHMVLLNTEFGRTPGPQLFDPDVNFGKLYEIPGRDHWPYGYVIVGFGGPVDTERAKIVGAIDGEGYASSYASPTEHRCATLLAMGIWPFAPESFAIGDIPGAGSELDAAMMLREKIFGYRG